MADYYRDYPSERYGYDRREGDDRYSGRQYGRQGRGEDRGVITRAGDEVRSWFGDEEAERRRSMDEQESSSRYGRESYGEYDRNAGRYGRRSNRSEEDYRRGYGQESYQGDYERGYGRGAAYSSGQGQSDAYQRTDYGRYGSQSSYGGGSDYGRYGSQSGYSGQGSYGSQDYGSRSGYGGQSNQGSYSGGSDYGRYGGQSSYGSGSYGSEYGGSEQYAGNRGPFTGRGPSGWRRSDERITEDVNECLEQHGQIDADAISVSVKDGEVTLSGTVNSRMEKRLAEDVAESCSGVKEVQNQLRVKQQGMSQIGQQTSPAQSSQQSSSRSRTTGT